MSLIKDLSKEKKQIDTQIKKITKSRLNDRTSDSWLNLRGLKKKKLAVKDKIHKIAKKPIASEKIINKSGSSSSGIRPS